MSYTLNYRGAKIDKLLGQVDEQFIAEYNVSLYADITAAIAAGKQVLLKKDNALYPYIGQDATSAYVFAMMDEGAILQLFTVSTASVWATVSKALQEELTFDAAPTDGSTNPVTSDGIYDAIKEAKAEAQEQSYDLLVTDTAQGAIATFPDGANDVPVKSLIAQITPLQDLHGQSAPYPAGGGKNKFQTTAVTTTNAAVLFTVNDDGTIKPTRTGSSTANASLLLGTVTLPVGSYLVNGGNSVNNAYMTLRDNATDAFIANIVNSDYALTVTEEKAYKLVAVVPSDSTPTATLYPMVRLATESDPTFAPYSNICPISGWTGAQIGRYGKNLCGLGFVGQTANPAAFSLVNDVITISAEGGLFLKSPIEAGKTYTLSGSTTATTSNIRAYPDFDASGAGQRDIYEGGSLTGAFSYTFTANLNGYIRLWFSGTGTITELQLEESATKTAYEPFQFINVDWTDEAGTVYGGTLTYIGSGKYSLQATHKKDTFTWADGTNSTTVSDYTRKNFALTSPALTASGITSNIAPFMQGQTSNPVPHTDFSTSSVARVYLPTSTDNATSIELLYAFATLPDPIILDAEDVKTLLGDNNIFCDTGDVDVTYRADTALYIDKKLGQ